MDEQGNGAPSALNGKRVNPALLELAAEHLASIGVRVSMGRKAPPKFFLEPKAEKPAVDWSALKIGRDEKPASTGFYDPDGHYLHG